MERKKDFTTGKLEESFNLNIILAGYNFDHETLKEIVASPHPYMKPITPETISAAYARISRNPRPVNELREIARNELEKARQSNRNIVFGMGHSSIAEHAVFNIDVLNVSRLLVEEIEKFRLCSYTEKSQRYVLMKDDFVIPEEIRQTGIEDSYISTIKEQNKFYHELYSALNPYIFEKNKGMAADPANHSVLEGWAKEDARYIISLATETQLGMTLNARNLELMLRRCAAHPTAEAREYSEKLYHATKDIAPSLIRYTTPTEFDLMTRTNLKTKVTELIEKRGGGDEKGGNTKDNVILSYSTPDADDKTVATLIHSSSNLPLKECMTIASSLEREEKEEIIKTACRHMKSYDAALREFENVELLFELTISATCFAQLKRHRIATITCQDYDPTLGITIPPMIYETGMENRFRNIISRTEETYDQIKKAAPISAAYILTNAHRKRVAIKINARELYHIARLRVDKNAQWDIRETAEKMLILGRKAMPHTLMLATGKDGFTSLYDQCFGDRK